LIIVVVLFALASPFGPLRFGYALLSERRFRPFFVEMAFAFRPGARLFRRIDGRAGSHANAGVLQNRKVDVERTANF